ncbi:GDP-mannose 4,6-dehydratase [Amylibacter sp.]|jgi:UDP-glucose 4-epimerase|nr:GDP-mannose 4,6-dehydratase [Amylibacter sp.]
MTVLVTGGAGFIGSNLSKFLAKEENKKVIVIDNLATGSKKNLVGSNISLVNADLSIRGDWERQLDGVQEIYHLAALADIVPSIEKPEKYYQANVSGTLNLLQAILERCPSANMVYTASSSCYGTPNIYPTPETSPVSPEYPYALTKMLGELLIMHWHKVYNIKANSCRLFNVYGNYSRNSGSYGAMFGVFLGQMINSLPITIVGDGYQSRDFTHVDDVVQALITTCRLNQKGEIFNVGSGVNVSVNEIVKHLGYNNIEHIEKRPGEPEITHADITKIKLMTNWYPKVSIDQGVHSLLKNIDLFSEMPAWTSEEIQEATKAWFQYLKD